MRIIEAISDTNIGGAGILLLNRLACTDTEKYQTTVILPKGSMLMERVCALGIKCVEIDCKGDASFDIHAMKEYRRVIKRISPDIINCHGCLSARVAAKTCGVPVKICTRHCVYPISFREKIFAPFNNILSEHFIAVAHSAKQNLVDMGVDKSKISVIINGASPLRRIDDEEREALKNKLQISDNTTVLGFCARLEGCKGHDWFIEVLRELSEHNVDFVALLIGDGSQRQNLIELCEKSGVSERVIFCGFVKDVAPLMNIVDVNINCSVGTETSSLALSEGMSLGLPAVVSDYGGNPYMIKHGVNGFVCHQGDHLKMAEYIETLIKDKKQYENMSVQARKRFEDELNAEAMTAQTNRLYDKLYQAYRRA